MATAREMQGVGEVHAPVEKVQRGDDPAGVLHVYVGKPEQMLDDQDHPRRLKPIEGPEHPFQFQDYGERNEQAGALGDDIKGDRALLDGLGVAGIIDIEPSQDIGIKGDHGPRRASPLRRRSPLVAVLRAGRTSAARSRLLGASA